MSVPEINAQTKCQNKPKSAQTLWNFDPAFNYILLWTCPDNCQKWSNVQLCDVKILLYVCCSCNSGHQGPQNDIVGSRRARRSPAAVG